MWFSISVDSKDRRCIPGKFYFLGWATSALLQFLHPCTSVLTPDSSFEHSVWGNFQLALLHCLLKAYPPLKVIHSFYSSKIRHQQQNQSYEVYPVTSEGVLHQPTSWWTSYLYWRWVYNNWKFPTYFSPHLRLFILAKQRRDKQKGYHHLNTLKCLSLR